MKVLKNNSRKNIIIKRQRSIILDLQSEVRYVDRQLYEERNKDYDWFNDKQRMQDEINEYYELKDKYIKLLASLKIKGVEISEGKL